MPRPRPSPDRILDAAEKVFLRQGYAGTRLRHLLSASGVSTTAFYARFPSVEAVLGALVERLLLQIHAAGVEGIGRARTLEEGFDLGVEALARELARRRKIARLVLTEFASSPASLAAFQRMLALLAEMLAARLARLEARGLIQAGDARSLGWAIVGALHMQIVRWAVFEDLGGADLAPALRATARTLLPAVLPGGRRAPDRRRVVP
jgi:AcrR family transcriptional regulator